MLRQTGDLPRANPTSRLKRSLAMDTNILFDPARDKGVEKMDGWTKGMPIMVY